MIKLKNILNEGLSPILFHFTHVNYVLKILRENKFHATTTMGTGTESKIGGKYFFFFSTTRVRSTGYYIGEYGTACIVLDGRKLNSKYKGFPVEYWQRHRDQFQSDKQYIEALKKLEQEDRIMLNSPTIDNAISYIIELNISIANSNSGIFNDEDMSELIKLCKDNNIKTYFYDNQKYFRFNNKAKAIDINNIKFPKKSDDYKDSEDYVKRSEISSHGDREKLELCILLSHKNEANYDKILKFYSEHDIFIPDKHEIFFAELQKNLENDAYNIFNHPYQFNIHDYYNSISNIIHNSRKETTSSVRFLVKMLADDIRKNKVSSLKEYIAMKLNIKLDDWANYV